MKQVERHLIKKNSKQFEEVDNLCFLSKNLYNASVYLIRQEFFKSNKVLSYNKAYHLLKTSVDYKALPAKVSQLIIKQVTVNFDSWIKAIKIQKESQEV